MIQRRIAIIAILAVISAAPAITLALGLQPIVPQSGQGSSCNGPGGCQSICDLAILAQNALTDGIYIAIFLSAILFAWAGWNMVVGSAAGNSTQVSQAKKIFWNVTIGLVLILSAWIIVSVIMAALTSNTSWNTLCAQQ